MKKSKTRVFYLRLVACLAALGILFSSGRMTEWQAHVSPGSSRIALAPVLDRAAVRRSAARLELEQAVFDAMAPVRGSSAAAESAAPQGYLFTEEEYKLFYHQTGLGKGALAAVLNEKDGETALLELQETFFTKPDYICVRDNWLTRREQTTDQYGNVTCVTELLGLEDGDILITKASHVLGWHNGHAALVLDAGKGLLLEAIVIGENTDTRRFKKWEKFPNYIVLRLEGVDKEKRAQVARWAEKNLLDIPYQLTAGFFGSKEDMAQKNAVSGVESDADAEAAAVTGTQCAHLIWRAYAQFGYDLDADGGWIVTPKQLVNSPLLEVVQVYGMDPDEPWS